MTTLQMGATFPDATLPDQRGQAMRLSSLTRPSQVDMHLGFGDGYPFSLAQQALLATLAAMWMSLNCGARR